MPADVRTRRAHGWRLAVLVLALGAAVAGLVAITVAAARVARAGRPVTIPGVSHARWLRISRQAAFEARDTADGFVYQGKMWLSNGYFGSGTDQYRDLWNSRDGATWTLVNSRTPYPPYAEMVVFKREIWAVKQSVWKSPDGVTWTQVLEKTPFGKRGYGHVVVFDGKLWHLGSGDDVWTSSDGVHWTCVLEHAPYGPRTSAAVAVFRGKLWLMGGFINRPSTPPEIRYPDWTSFNDVWSSEDGVHWVRVLEHAPWRARAWAVAAAYDDRLWVLAGFSNRENINFNTAWFTTDGQSWQRLSVNQAFPTRHQPAAYVFARSLWIVAGNTWPLLNDVWKLTLRTPTPGEVAAID